MVTICSFLFRMNHIQCLGYHTTKENKSSSINVNDYHNILCHLVDYVYCCPIEPLMFIWMNIGPATPISILHYSDLVS